MEVGTVTKPVVILAFMQELGYYNSCCKWPAGGSTIIGAGGVFTPSGSHDRTSSRGLVCIDLQPELMRIQITKERKKEKRNRRVKCLGNS
jgi:hypothetical protein